MVKRKNRATRKLQRERAARAETRGLPPAKVAPSVPRPKFRAAATRRGGGSRGASEAAQGSGAWLKIAIGLCVALALVFVLSQSRKAELMESRSSSGAPSDAASSDAQKSVAGTISPVAPGQISKSESLASDEPHSDGVESPPAQ